MSKQNKKMDNVQVNEQTTAGLEEIINLLAQRGIISDKNIDGDKMKSVRQEKKKKAYHNTLLILKNYGTIAWMLECFPDTLAEELEQPFETIRVDSLNSGKYDGGDENCLTGYLRALLHGIVLNIAKAPYTAMMVLVIGI